MKYCLYRHFDNEGLLLYVGMSRNPLQRLSGHRTTSAWYEYIATVTIQRFETKQAGLDAEYDAMLFERPKFNRNGAIANYEEIAVILGVSLEEVRQRFKRGNGHEIT